MKTNKSIIGFFKSKCIKNEISFLIKKKGIKFLNLNNIEDLGDKNKQTSLLIIDITSKKDMSKFEKILQKYSHYIIFIMREDNIKTSLLGNLHFIYPPIKPFDFVEQVEKFFNSIERGRQRKKIGEFILTSSELISNRKKEKIRLTTLEIKFLNFLYKSKEGFTKKELLEYVWDYNAKVETHTLESLVYRLRRKLESDPNSPKILVQTGNKYILKS